MQAKIVTILSLLVFGSLTSKKDVESCERACPNLYKAAQGICSSDGKIYIDLCFAKCHDKSAIELFVCDFPFDRKERKRCATECAERVRQTNDTQEDEDNQFPYDDLKALDCYSKCKIDPKPTLICASDGAVYANECHAKCFDKNVAQLFECTELGEAGCSEKCEVSVKAKQCAEKCPWFAGQYQICASDGNLYAGECRAKCTDSENYSLFSCAKLGEEGCKKECAKQKSILNCQNDCPKYKRRLMYWRANDGKVYDDLCKAQCVDKSIEFTFNCEDKGISTDNKTKCEQICKPQLSCEKKCASHRTKHVCASDGVIYKNSCFAACKNLRILYSARRFDKKEQKKCAVRASIVDSSLE